MHPNTISAGAPPQTPLGELTALPRPPHLDLGPLCGRGRGWPGKRREREGKGREGKLMGGKGRSPKLLKPAPLRALLRRCLFAVAQILLSDSPSSTDVFGEL